MTKINRFINFAIYCCALLLFILMTNNLQAQSDTLSWDFESNNINDTFSHIGWGATDCQATVADDLVTSGNKVLKVEINNYNAAPVLKYVLPAGKTLADYSSFTFKGNFAQGDVGYKTIVVEAYQTMPTAQFGNNTSVQIGSWARSKMGSTSWEDITVDIPNSSTFKDTIYIAFGINCAGTGDVGGAGSKTIWYADDITLVAKPAANTNSIFAVSKNSVDFGIDTVGVAKKQSVTISNPGTDTLKVTSISSTNALFTFSPSVFSIAPSDSSILDITFTPVDTSNQSGFIILAHNAEGSPDSISVMGKGLQGDIIIPIVTNGSFESSDIGTVDTTEVKGWLIQVASGVTSSPVFQVVSDTVEDGNRALKVTINGAGTNQWDIQIVADSLHVKPGGIYNYSIWAKAETAGAQVNFTVGKYDYSEYSVIRPANLTTTWQKFTMQFTVTDNNIYIRGPIHFSYAGNTGNTIYIDNLQIVENIEDPGTIYEGPPLAHKQDKFLGSAYSTPQTFNFESYWNKVTPENAGKWGSVEGTRDQMNWGALDAAYNFAKENNFPFHFHVLIWGAQQPSWIDSLTSEEQLEEIREWFEAVAQKYPDIDYLEVVNEPLLGHNPPDGTRDGTRVRANYKNALGGNGTTGWDWVINAFKMAREIFPAKTKLMLNDFSIINSSTSTAEYLKIIRLLQKENLIDLIGEQGHAFTTTAEVAIMKRNLDSLASTGIPIHITELDIDGATDQIQLTQYKRIFPALWKHPGVEGITLWGWRPGLWRDQQKAYLISSNNVERPALVWLRDYLDTVVVSVDEELAMPQNFELFNNYRNPFNPSTNIKYNVAKQSHVSLKIYDVLGRVVQTLVNNVQSPGQYTVTFNAHNLASGIYFYRLEAGGFVQTKKLMLMK